MPTPIDPSLIGWPPPGLEFMLVTPPPAMYLNGTSDYASAAGDAYCGGDIDIRVALAPTVSAWNAPLVSKWRTAGQRCFRFGLDTAGTGKLRFGYTADGSTERAAVSGLTLESSSHTIDTQPVCVRANYVAATGTLTLYNRPFYFTKYMDDLADDTVATGKWKSFSTNALTAGAVFNGTSELDFGTDGAGGFAMGGIYGAVIKGSGGTIIASPDFGAQTDYLAAFLDAIGITYTMQSNAYMIPLLSTDALLEDGSPFDPSVYPDLDQALAHGKVYGTDPTTGWPLLPDMMNGARYPRAGWQAGTTGGVDSHTFGGSSAFPHGGTFPAVSNIDGAQVGTMDNNPLWMKRSFWIKT